jgi:2'-5' RNA ligase
VWSVSDGAPNLPRGKRHLEQNENMRHGRPMTQTHSYTPGDELERSERLLFLIRPDQTAAEAIAAQAERIRREYGLRGERLRTDRLHFTLHHLGDHAWLPALTVLKACAAAERVDLAAFDVTLDRMGTYAPGGRTFDMIAMEGSSGVVQLSQFQRALGAAMNRAGLSDLVKRRFIPHVTLIYDSQRVPPRPIAPISWRVREFSLVHSRMGRTEHITLASWALPDR